MNYPEYMRHVQKTLIEWFTFTLFFDFSADAFEYGHVTKKQSRESVPGIIFYFGGSVIAAYFATTQQGEAHRAFAALQAIARDVHAGNPAPVSVDLRVLCEEDPNPGELVDPPEYTHEQAYIAQHVVDVASSFAPWEFVAHRRKVARAAARGVTPAQQRFDGWTVSAAIPEALRKRLGFSVPVRLALHYKADMARRDNVYSWGVIENGINLAGTRQLFISQGHPSPADSLREAQGFLALYAVPDAVKKDQESGGHTIDDDGHTVDYGARTAAALALRDLFLVIATEPKALEENETPAPDAAS